MKRIKPFISILIFIIFISIITGCNTNNDKLEIDSGQDGTHYTFEQTVTVSCCNDPKYQDTVYCVEDANDPIICGDIYRFAYHDKELLVNMNNKYYVYNTENDELSKLSNDEFYSKYADYDTYKWYYPHRRFL